MCKVRDFSVQACPQTLQTGVPLLQRSDGRIQTKADGLVGHYTILGDKTQLTWCVTKCMDFGIRQCSTGHPIIMNKLFHFSEFVFTSIRWKYKNKMK